MKHWSVAFVLLAVLLAGLVVSPNAALSESLAAPAAPATLGWVGDMYPRPGNGSPQTITAGGGYTVYVQVHKVGVTPPAGQGAGITCTLHWGQVSSFGSEWSNITDTPMVYNKDINNNDEYMASISPGPGLYEHTAFCTDTTDNTSKYQEAGGAQLTVTSAPSSCGTPSTNDDFVNWAGLFHDSFSMTFRNPIGPVATGQNAVTLKFRTCQDDVQNTSIRVWNDRTNKETILPLTFDSNGTVSGIGNVTYWKVDLPISTLAAQPTVLYYVFRATGGTATAFYRDDDPRFYGGGYGAAEGTLDSIAYNNSYQLTVYDPNFSVPEWMQRGTVYQIFPDRFRDGNSGNNPAAGRFSYNTSGAIVRSNQTTWNYTVCDPRSIYTPACAGKYGDNFYGGDLRGIIQKIEDGYFDNLGVSVLYLNPIFRAPSNHKYDTADFMVIDPDFGTLADFQELTAKAEARGIKVILDGVFNHTSSDSKYFDRYSRYDADGNLTSQGVGTDDNSGACEAGASSFYSWFYFPATGNPGADGGVTVYCNNGAGDAQQTYEAWYGYSSLPKLQANTDAVRKLIWARGTNSVGPYWVSQGADGWRFDVGKDVDPGLTDDPSNDYWEGFRSAVRAVNPQALTLGEEWGDASPWLLGSEWDSVMNYRFRSALLSWLFTGCVSGSNGCTGGASFADNDSNSGSSSGAISYISPSLFNARLRSIAEDYPPQALKAMMNLEGSHDTSRVRFLLKKANNDNDAAAVQRMKEWWLFAFTYPGAPTLYYGDEIGLNHDGVWACDQSNQNCKYEDDPYNRTPYPWPDAGGSTYSYDTTASGTGLQAFARQMASIRWSYRALQDGDVQHGLIINDGQKLYGYARTYGTYPDTQTALIALNRDGAAHIATFTGLNAAPYYLANGTVLVNALDPTQTVTVIAADGGSASITVSSTWGVVLLEQAKIETPAAVSDLSGSVVGGNVTLTWSTVAADTAGGRELVTAYRVHRSTDPNFIPDSTTFVGTVTPSDSAPAPFLYGSIGGKFSYAESVPAAAAGSEGALRPNADYYYRVCPVNAPGIRGACSGPVAPTAVTLTNLAATSQGEAIEIAWGTVNEADNLGFNLYRDTSEAGPGARLNAGLIPAQGPGGPLGHHYTYLDAADLAPGAIYYYWLEDVSTTGIATRHGPISVRFGGEPNAVGLAAFRATGGVDSEAAGLTAWAALAGAASTVLALARVGQHRRKMKDEG